MPAMEELLAAVVLGSAVAIAVDASRLGARRGVLGGGLLDMGPAGWFVACLLVWVVTLPCYLARRPALVRRARVLAWHPQFAPAPAGPAPVIAGGYGLASNPAGPLPLLPQPGAAPPPLVGGPPPGYYPNPDPNGFGTLWWDGANWEGTATD